jgi:hypothetical protein
MASMVKASKVFLLTTTHEKFGRRIHFSLSFGLPLRIETVSRLRLMAAALQSCWILSCMT